VLVELEIPLGASRLLLSQRQALRQDNAYAIVAAGIGLQLTEVRGPWQGGAVMIVSAILVG
jgi:hypothetical protein